MEKGSTARKLWVGRGTQNSSYGKIFRELIDQGVLALKGDLNEFTRDFAFKSTSAAAGIVSGRHTNGPQSWILEGTSKKYADWEADRL